MPRFLSIRTSLPIAAGLLALAVVVVPVSAASGDTVANARDATAAFQSPAAALAAGYELLTDASDIACIDQPGMGAMGIHYVKGALVQSGTIDAARPQALVYERTEGSQLRLVAIEYVTLQAGWDASHNAPPELFGHKFMLTPAGNRYGLPAFYSLHAWIWKDNPSGMFAMWNPSVSCNAGHDQEADNGAPDTLMNDSMSGNVPVD